MSGLTISTENLERRLNHNALQFWNVLTDEYFLGKTIPGSRRVPLDTLNRELVETHLPKDAEVIVYCAGPICPQSLMATDQLTAAGYTSVRAYEGGVEEWVATGREIVIEEPVTS